MAEAVRTVKELKESLDKEVEKSDDGERDHERCLDIIKRLDECEINLTVLSETLIGTSVSKLKASTNTDVASNAKALVKKWKKLAKESGASARRPSSTSSAPAKKKPATPAPAKKKPARPAPPPVEDHEEWQHLPPPRQNMCKKFHSIFLLSRESLTKSSELDASAISDLSASRSCEIEEAIQKANRGDRHKCMDKARSLSFNLKKNANLRENVLFGHTSGAELVSMTPDQMATSEKTKARAELVGHLQDSRRLDWEQANEKKINEMCGIKGDLLKASLFTCGRCKSHKTTSTQKQTRSADEPMTVFVFCMNCGNRWKC